MKCQYHPDHEAIGVCAICGRAICEEDMNLVDQRYVCNPCFRARRKPIMKKKSPGLTVFFNCLPGAGYLYIGLYFRALVAFLIFIASIEIDLPWLGMALYIFIFFDGFRQARLINADLYQEAGPAERKENLILGIFLIVIGVLLLFNIYIDLSFLSKWWPGVLVLLGVWLVWRSLKERGANESPEKEPQLASGSDQEENS